MMEDNIGKVISRNIIMVRNATKAIYGFLLYLLLSVCNSGLIAQELSAERVPRYTVAYNLPKPDSILFLLKKVRQHYESTGRLQVMDKSTGKPVTDLITPNRNAIIPDGLSGEWSYTNGVVFSAFSYIQDVTGDTSFFSLNKRFFDFVLQTLPYFRKNRELFGKAAAGWPAILDMHALDDCGSIGASLIKTYRKTNNKNYLELISLIDNFILHKQFRLNDGTLARHRPQYKSLWADDIYMSVPFLANMGAMTGITTYYDDAVKQILQMAKHLYVPGKELFDHGWSVTSGEYDPRFYWGRANGWILMAMTELLSVLPENYPGRAEVLHLYRSVIRSLASLQDGSGFWHNLLDRSDTYLETSCTAMFTFAIAKGINEGWINHVYGPVAVTGWNAVRTAILSTGAVDGTCEATTFAHDNVYYYNRGKSIRATHGYGPVLYAGAEMIRLLRNDQLQIVPPQPGSINSTIHFKSKKEWPAQ
jgi:unsaturated rhamnogalacturonyl hydrolase